MQMNETLTVLLLAVLLTTAMANNQWTDAGLADYPEPGPDGQLIEMLESLNITDENELVCLYNFLQTPYPPPVIAEDAAPSQNGAMFCNSTWDGISCWPTTLAGSTSVLPCFAELNGVKYDTTRKCFFHLCYALADPSRVVQLIRRACGHEYLKTKAAYTQPRTLSADQQTRAAFCARGTKYSKAPLSKQRNI